MTNKLLGSVIAAIMVVVAKAAIVMGLYNYINNSFGLGDIGYLHAGALITLIAFLKPGLGK